MAIGAMKLLEKIRYQHFSDVMLTRIITIGITMIDVTEDMTMIAETTVSYCQGFTDSEL